MKKGAFLVLLVVSFLCVIGISTAAALRFDLDLRFGDGPAPGGPRPWLTAEVNLVSTGFFNVLELVLSTANLVQSEFVDSWHFNLNPSFQSLPITFEYKGPPVSSGPGAIGKPLADSDFDFIFDFPEAGDKFDKAETVTYLITGTGITESLFDVLNEDGFYSGARIGGIDSNGGFAWIAAAQDKGPGPDPDPIPEPATLLLLGAGLSGLGFFSRSKLLKK